MNNPRRGHQIPRQRPNWTDPEELRSQEVSTYLPGEYKDIGPAKNNAKGRWVYHPPVYRDLTPEELEIKNDKWLSNEDFIKSFDQVVRIAGQVVAEQWIAKQLDGLRKELVKPGYTEWVSKD